MGRSVNDGTPCSSQLIHAEQRIAELELQLSEAQDSYKVMCDRVNELEWILYSGWQAAEAIRAELEPVTRPEQEG